MNREGKRPEIAAERCWTAGALSAHISTAGSKPTLRALQTSGPSGLINKNAVAKSSRFVHETNCVCMCAFPIHVQVILFSRMVVEQVKGSVVQIPTIRRSTRRYEAIGVRGI